MWDQSQRLHVIPGHCDSQSCGFGPFKALSKQIQILEWRTDAFGVCPSLRLLGNPLLESLPYPASSLLRHLILNSCSPSWPVF